MNSSASEAKASPPSQDLDSPRLRARWTSPVLWAVLATLVWRLAFLLWTGFAIESDEAVIGLMAKHIGELREFPVWYYGQEYMGALEAYVAAPFVKLFGSNAVSLKLTALAFALVFAWASALFAQQVFGKRPALFFTLAYLVAGPLILTLWTVKLRGGFVSTLAIGQLVLLLALRLGTRGASVRGAGALGLLAGLGVWMNPLVAPFLGAAGLFLVGRRQFIARRAAVAACLGGALLGSAPFWIYNLRHSWGTFRVLLGGEGNFDVGKHLVTTFEDHLPVLLGVLPPWPPERAVPLWGWPLLVLFALASLALLWHARRGLAGLVLPSYRPTNGAELYVLTALGFLVCAMFTRFGAEPEPRYAIVLYVFLAPALGLLFGSLWERGRPGRLVSALAFAGVLVVNTGSIYGFDRRLPTQPLFNIRDGVVNPLDQSPLYRVLEQEGIDGLNAEYWMGYRIAYETGERVVTVPGRYGPYTDLFRKTRRQAWLFRDGGVPLRQRRALLAELDSLAIPFREKALESYWLILPDTGIPRERWQGSSSTGTEANLAFDRDHSSRWTTGSAQQPGQWLEVDLGGPRTVERISVLFGQGDAPRRLRLEASPEGTSWETLTETEQVTRSWVFSPAGRTVRKLRLTQLGSLPNRWWSVHEIYVYGPKDE